MEDLKKFNTTAKNIHITKKTNDYAKQDKVRAKTWRLREAEWRLQFHDQKRLKILQEIEVCKAELICAQKTLEEDVVIRNLRSRPNINFESLFTQVIFFFISLFLDKI